MNKIVEIAKTVAAPWKESSYYDQAEEFTHMFWNEGTIFRRFFNRMDLRFVTELSCGKGRHSEQVVNRTERLTLVDVFKEHLDDCQRRLAQHKNVDYVLGNGFDFEGIASSSQTAVFCYDAMVHFAPEIVRTYLIDGFRILVPGGMALYHHSNYDTPTDQDYGLNPQARNKMTRSLFNFYAEEAGLMAVEAEEISWGSIANLDGVTLLRRPTR